MYEVKILCNDGSTSWEPLKNIPSDWLVAYTLEHSLLNTKGWKHFSQHLTDESNPEAEASQAVTRRPAFSSMVTTMVNTIFVWAKPMSTGSCEMP